MYNLLQCMELLTLGYGQIHHIRASSLSFTGLAACTGDESIASTTTSNDSESMVNISKWSSSKCQLFFGVNPGFSFEDLLDNLCICTAGLSKHHTREMILKSNIAQEIGFFVCVLLSSIWYSFWMPCAAASDIYFLFMMIILFFGY